jgi:hypothetical protein
MKKAELVTSLLLILPCRNQNTAPTSGNSDTTFCIKTPINLQKHRERIQHSAIRQHLTVGTRNTPSLGWCFVQARLGPDRSDGLLSRGDHVMVGTAQTDIHRQKYLNHRKAHRGENPGGSKILSTRPNRS